MRLVCHAADAEPWPIDDDLGVTLEDAFREVGDQIASDAGSELLDDGADEERDELRESIVADMRLALRGVGDSWRTPDGVRYSLEDDRTHPRFPDWADHARDDRRIT